MQTLWLGAKGFALSRWRRQQRKRFARRREAGALAHPWRGGGYLQVVPAVFTAAPIGPGAFRDELDLMIPRSPAPVGELRAALEQKIAEIRKLGLGPPLVPPEGVRPVLLATDDPTRFNLAFVKEENN